MNRDRVGHEPGALTTRLRCLPAIHYKNMTFQFITKIVVGRITQSFAALICEENDKILIYLKDCSIYLKDFCNYLRKSTSQKFLNEIKLLIYNSNFRKQLSDQYDLKRRKKTKKRKLIKTKKLYNF